MSRWIDADKLNIDFYDEVETADDEYAYAYVSEYQIDTAPSIDIVRCGECKYWKSTVQMPNGTEVKCLYGRTADDFCSYGCRDSEKPNNSDVSKTKQAEKYPYNSNWDE